MSGQILRYVRALSPMYTMFRLQSSIYSKNFLILYTPFENSTTRIAIIVVCITDKIHEILTEEA